MAVVVTDLDSVLAFPVDDFNKYAQCKPNPVMREVLKLLRDRGHRIVIHTARWKEDREVTEGWLSRYGFPYDELVLEKPLADIYIDDKAMKYVAGQPSNFSDVYSEILERIK